jgi:uncharacterized RDD family membrane protein YckC
VLDTTRVVETPEGVELALHVAGPVPRALAWVIDFLIRTVIYIVLAFTFSVMGKMGMGLLAIVVFLMEWWYPVLFEVHDHGRTPGKRALGLHVLHDNGTPVGWSASLVRNLLRAVDFLPLFYGFGLAAMLVNRDFKRLGDLAAGTVVVHAHENGRYLRLPAVSPLMAPVPLTREEQRALLDFAERSELLSAERRVELARLLTPLTGVGDAAGVETLHRYAAWIAGREQA